MEYLILILESAQYFFWLIDLKSAINKKYINIKDMAQFIANEMLESKDLPEYIQFNLKDQFGVKIKKLETK